MRKIFLLGILTLFSSTIYSQSQWIDIAVIEDLEVYVDTTTIKYKDGFSYAWVKTTYTTDDSRELYVNKIRKAYGKQDAKTEKKLRKWDNFRYNISYRKYDCLNKCYQILEITDYASDNKKIVKTKTDKKRLRWLNVGMDTMGDYTLYFICDYNTQ